MKINCPSCGAEITEFKRHYRQAHYKCNACKAHGWVPWKDDVSLPSTPVPVDAPPVFDPPAVEAPKSSYPWD